MPRPDKIGAPGHLSDLTYLANVNSTVGTYSTLPSQARKGRQPHRPACWASSQSQCTDAWGRNVVKGSRVSVQLLESDFLILRVSELLQGRLGRMPLPFQKCTFLTPENPLPLPLEGVLLCAPST